MLDEVLWMEIRISRMYCNIHGCSMCECNKLFDSLGIYDMIEDCYGYYHTVSDEIVYNNLFDLISERGELV